MGEAKLPILLLLLAIFMTSIYRTDGQTDEKIWPDLSCHGNFDNDWRTEALAAHKTSWQQCQIRNSETGPCAKTCQLKAFSVLYPHGSKNTPVFDFSAAGTYYKRELGLKSEHYKKEDRRAENISLPIFTRLSKCKQWASRPLPDRNWDGPSCEGWADVLDCIDEGYGCASGEFKHI